MGSQGNCNASLVRAFLCTDDGGAHGFPDQAVAASSQRAFRIVGTSSREEVRRPFVFQISSLDYKGAELLAGGQEPQLDDGAVGDGIA